MLKYNRITATVYGFLADITSNEVYSEALRCMYY